MHTARGKEIGEGGDDKSLVYKSGFDKSGKKFYNKKTDFIMKLYNERVRGVKRGAW